ncbi:fatty acid desaturase family protein [Nocardioides terrisoli]|uniref:fatty acid desaturase family protein n=1 Tax=Nocardioides terrisoli TaxID=3388267 RepID=UPI00287B82DD|nr:acyl-CoA desaturase [Nocardioides marmorisolisilvae]
MTVQLPIVPPVARPAPPSGYAALSALVRERNLLRRRPWFYAGVFAANLLVTALVVAAMVVWRDSWWLLLLAPVLAVVSVQFGFFGHDVGHQQVTRDRRLSRALGLVSGDLLAGLSYAWWVTKHNAHHAHPNDLATDPDVRAGALVFDADQADQRSGAAAWLTRHQAAMFFPMLLGEAVNLHVSSVREMFKPKVKGRAIESVLLTAHLAGYVALLVFTLTWPQVLAFVVLQKALQGVYLGMSFAPGHKGMPVMDVEQAADPFLRQVLTSRNVRGGWFTDAALGGLNYQVEHHLFPSMPRPNLRLAQPIVRQFCADRGVTYTETAALASYAAGLRHLHAVGTGLRSRGRS